MRVAYTDENGKDCVIEVSSIAQRSTRSIYADTLVFELWERPIREYISFALRKGYLDLRPATPTMVVEDGIEFDGYEN